MSVTSQSAASAPTSATNCRIFSFVWWATLLTIVSGAITISAYAMPWCLACWRGDGHRDIPVFVQDGHGVPVTGIYLRLENGAVLDLDDGGNAVIPKENIGKPISIRDRKTGREVKVFHIPKIIEPNGPLEIVVPVLK